jgi:hypothetical protein
MRKCLMMTFMVGLASLAVICQSSVFGDGK